MILPGIRTNQFYLVWNNTAASVGDVIQKDLSITYKPKSEQDYCIYDAIYAATIADMEVQPTTLDGGSFDPTTQEFLYDSHVTYYCGLGRVFETNSGNTEPQQDFLCYWSGTWNPKPDLMPCICKRFNVVFSILLISYVSTST